VRIAVRYAHTNAPTRLQKAIVKLKTALGSVYKKARSMLGFALLKALEGLGCELLQVRIARRWIVSELF
jgi:hypothetical protein